MPVQVRRGAPFALIRTAVRAARTRSSKPASRVRLPGGTPTACVGPVMPQGVARAGTSALVSHDLPGWRSWQRGRLLTVSPQVRILPLVQRPTTSPPGGSGAALRRPRREFESPRGDTSGPVRIWEARRLSTAQGEFDSRPDRNDAWLRTPTSGRGSTSRTCAVSVRIRPQPPRQGIPTSRGRRLRPGVLQVQILSLARRTNARVAQRKCSRMISGRREVRPLPRARNARAERIRLPLRKWTTPSATPCLCVFHGEAVGTEHCPASRASRVQLPLSPPH